MIYNNDTIVLLDYKDIQKANLLFVDRLRLQEVNDTLLNSYRNQSILANTQDELITNQSKSLRLQQGIILNQDSIINYKNDNINQLNKKVKRQKLIIRILEPFSIIGVVTLGILIFK